jgi:hypothetical protein
MFTDGPTDEVSSAIVHRDLRYIASSTLLVHELHLARLIGSTRLGSWDDAWVAANLPLGSPSVGLAGRRQFI